MTKYRSNTGSPFATMTIFKPTLGAFAVLEANSVLYRFENEPWRACFYGCHYICMTSSPDEVNVGLPSATLAQY